MMVAAYIVSVADTAAAAFLFDISVDMGPGGMGAWRPQDWIGWREVGLESHDGLR